MRGGERVGGETDGEVQFRHGEALGAEHPRVTEGAAFENDVAEAEALPVPDRVVGTAFDRGDRLLQNFAPHEVAAQEQHVPTTLLAFARIIYASTFIPGKSSPISDIVTVTG